MDKIDSTTVEAGGTADSGYASSGPAKPGGKS